jgi:hypothetical protein
MFSLKTACTSMLAIFFSVEFVIKMSKAHFLKISYFCLHAKVVCRVQRSDTQPGVNPIKL